MVQFRGTLNSKSFKSSPTVAPNRLLTHGEKSSEMDGTGMDKDKVDGANIFSKTKNEISLTLAHCNGLSISNGLNCII